MATPPVTPAAQKMTATATSVGGKPNPAIATAPGQQGPTRTALAAPPFRIEEVSKKMHYLKLLAYGNFGTGKTTLAATSMDVPSMRDVLILNAEAGDLAVDGYEGLDTIRITNFKVFGRIYEFLKAHCAARDRGDIDYLRASEASLKGVEPETILVPRQYRTVIFDSLTEIEAYCMNQLMGITDSTKLDDEAESAEWAEYKKQNTMILRVIRAFRDLPLHVIFICSEQYVQDESKKFKYSPDMTGKLSKKIQGFMDMVGYLVVGKEGDRTIRRLYVTPSAAGKYDAKHRYSRFKGEHFDNPTIASIMKQTGLDS